MLTSVKELEITQGAIKALQTIKSCYNIDELSAAKKMVENYKKLWLSRSKELTTEEMYIANHYFRILLDSIDTVETNMLKDLYL